MYHSDAGKGSAQRPVDKKKFEDNWDRIFGKSIPVAEAVKTDKAVAEELEKVLSGEIHLS